MSDLFEIGVVGGPCDGMTKRLPPEVVRVGKIVHYRHDALMPDGRPKYSLYIIGLSLQYLGATDELTDFEEVETQCRACSMQVLAVKPKRSEYPLECSGCHALTVWPLHKEV